MESRATKYFNLPTQYTLDMCTELEKESEVLSICWTAKK
ncbi:unnamed protein product [Brassica rapa subsp. trilocularis]|uniref:Uncharacterized protein n=1 Tax=Brassica campestris TaxID=3711 RepID=A0A3P5ZVE7_BRACM|nr:unnamed protein product [Brassica rapa]